MSTDSGATPEVTGNNLRARLLAHGLTFLLMGVALWAGVCGARWGIANFTNDDGTYWGSALALEAGRGYTIDFSPTQAAVDRFPPGWPLLLAMVFRLFGRGDDGIIAAQVLNLFMWAGALTLAYHAVVRRTGRPYWLVWGALVLLAVNPLAIETVALLMSEPLTVLLVTLALMVWHRKPTGLDLGVLGLLLGYAVLTRYAVLPLLLVAVADAAWRLRGRAWPILVGLALPMLPYASWWWAFRGLGYVSQAAYWSSAGWLVQIGSLLISLSRTFLQALPSLVLPGLFLARYPLDTDLPWSQPLLVLLALAWDVVFLVVLWRSRARTGWAGGPLIGILAYLALVTAWQSAFLNLKEHLPFRLLMPVLPVLLVWAGEGMALAIRDVKGKLQRAGIASALVVAAVSLHDAFVATWSIRTHNETVMHRTYAVFDQVRLDRTLFPKDATVATDFGGLYHQATGGKVFALTGGIDPEIDRMVFLAGVDLYFIMMSPKEKVGDQSVWWAMPHLNARYPGLVVPKRRKDGTVTSWYTVDPAVRAAWRRRLLQRVSRG
ncbi:MAG: hypothetical protein FJY99_08280 [Candidatus Sericytochromatia bacterium]|nr:hypothetical protein [Candidatus Tanganyikabacteria bacterium]